MASSGIAGRTNYRDWDKKTSSILTEADEQEQDEQAAASKALGLDGKYARSQSEAEERTKSKEVQEAKRVLDNYRQREDQVMQTCKGLLGGPTGQNESKTTPTTIRLTRHDSEAGKRVMTVCDTSGSSLQDKIILTTDLSLLESKIKTNATATPKSYAEDAENQVPQPAQQERTVYGLIKLFISNIHNCTIIVRCKIISGTIELSHCSNVIVKIEQQATVATLQVDLCQDLAIQFHDAPSGQNSGLPGQPKLFWGDDKNDRIFHAGVTMKVSLYRDTLLETETIADYLRDGAVAVGNASLEECQFVTSVVNGKLTTERVIRHGGTTGKNARAMTQRELDEERVKREKAGDLALEKAIRFVEKGQGEKKEAPTKAAFVPREEEEEEQVEEVYTMAKSEIDMILAECEQNKSRGNEAFGAGEYAQAVLLYSLALDKADELPDKESKGAKQLFPRHIVLSNRSAAFLKLGEHEKALADGQLAHDLDPTYVKGSFRTGLALHALGRYEEAIQALATAQKLEPKNKQIKQALKFAEVRMTQEMRKRMDG